MPLLLQAARGRCTTSDCGRIRGATEQARLGGRQARPRPVAAAATPAAGGGGATRSRALPCRAAHPLPCRFPYAVQLRLNNANKFLVCGGTPLGGRGGVGGHGHSGCQLVLDAAFDAARAVCDVFGCRRPGLSPVCYAGTLIADRFVLTAAHVSPRAAVLRAVRGRHCCCRCRLLPACCMPAPACSNEWHGTSAAAAITAPAAACSAW